MASWGYAKDNGPLTWEKAFPIAAGKHQSPIDIKRSDCVVDGALKTINVDYSSVEVGEVTNTGTSWKAQVTGGKSSLTGGPLKSTYALEQFHAHWGNHDKAGSEHTLDGTTYSAEARCGEFFWWISWRSMSLDGRHAVMAARREHETQLHLVHWNSDNYKSFDQAVEAKDGLAVLGVFLKVGKANPEFEKLIQLLPFIRHKNQTVNISKGINCFNFLPYNRSYYSYKGSLTTPPCFESVTWIVFDEPVEFSAEQLAVFRSLKSYCKSGLTPRDTEDGCMVDNFRPCCPLNDREVRVFREHSPREE